MITITFYKYGGKTNAIPKTLGTGTDMQGLLRDTYDILRPTITVRQSAVFDYNYCYVPVFNRYYFIENIGVESADIYALSLSVDVLQTYRESILASRGVISQSDNPNKHANNRNTVYDSMPNFQKLEFPNKDLFNKDGTIIMVTIKGDI